ncbi:MAG: class I SAM-dependent methyltransferase [Desulfobacteraceae bacterium]|nr:MAG: class I SAM-dependent methyltransferase [Desulfobacteraceae bacterium]
MVYTQNQKDEPMYNREYQGDVCSHSHSFFLDNFIRKLIQNPHRIVGQYIETGNTVIDLGCGPGFFSIAMAEMVGKEGKVYSVDLQPEMLDIVEKKAAKKNLTGRMIFHLCAQDTIGLEPEVKADFILAYYMVHETPDHAAFLGQVREVLKPGGRFLLVEPIFHVNRDHFNRITRDAEHAGLTVLGTPPGKGGRTLLLSK